MSNEPLAAHSHNEIDLYLMVTLCGACGGGPLVRTAENAAASDGPSSGAQITAKCSSCGDEAALTFTVPVADHPGVTDDYAINPTHKPSRILDVGQWIVLSRMLGESANRNTDKSQARSDNLRAALCLEEAIKFYDDPDNDLPPSEAFFCDASRTRFRDAPGQFSRRRLVNLRAKLPTPSPERRTHTDE